MNIVTKQFDYSAADVLCKGLVAYDDSIISKRPLVLIAPDWSGRNEFADEKAKQLASLGYIACAIDMYGAGRTGISKEEKSALMQPLVQDRQLLLTRIKAAYDAAKAFSFVDTQKIGAIGFCFGGLCVLDLARSGIALSGVVSFHGVLLPPVKQHADMIKTKILVLHGFADPMVSRDAVLAFADEMTKAKADWQIHMYGNVMHAFTNPQANDANFGTVYNSVASKRSWQTMVSFFTEVFT